MRRGRGFAQCRYSITVASKEKDNSYEERRAKGEESPKDDIEHDRPFPLYPEGPLAPIRAPFRHWRQAGQRLVLGSPAHDRLATRLKRGSAANILANIDARYKNIHNPCASADWCLMQEEGTMIIFLKTLINLFHHLPIKSGLTRLSFNPIINKLISKIPRIATAKLGDGSSIEVDTSDYHGRVLFLFGTNDPKVEQTANSLLAAGDVFLDIGANYSSIGLSASHVVGPNGIVHLFEPQRILADRVQAAIKSGGYSNVRLHRLGLMDHNAKVPLRSPAHHSGMATFVSYKGSQAFEMIEECDVREIGAYAGPLVAGRTFGAKLDIEGAEPVVMPWLLAQRNLRFLIFEAAHNQRALYEAVKDAALILYGLMRHPLKLRIARVDEFAQTSRFHDLVAIRTRDGYPLPAEVHPRYFG